jgi:hypothetical protein
MASIQLLLLVLHRATITGSADKVLFPDQR